MTYQEYFIGYKKWVKNNLKLDTHIKYGEILSDYDKYINHYEELRWIEVCWKLGDSYEECANHLFMDYPKYHLHIIK